MATNTGGTPGKLKFAIIPVTRMQQNCTLWWDDISFEGAIVDPGGDLNYVKHVILKAGMRPTKILLTHGHIDHAGGARQLQEELNIEIEGPHIDDAFLLKALTRQTPQMGQPVRDVTSDRWLHDGDIVDVAGHPLEVRHCPGHTPGSVVYISHKHRLIIMGDVLMKGGIGSTDLPYGDRTALIDAIKSKILPLGDDYAFICGHGNGSLLGEERKSNPALRHL